MKLNKDMSNSDVIKNINYDKNVIKVHDSSSFKH